MVLDTPYEHLDGFIKCSPIAYIKNVRTPTLILQGEADTTDPVGQSQLFYRGEALHAASDSCFTRASLTASARRRST